MAKQKVQIKTAEYREDKDLIFWTLLDAKKEQTYCWPSLDYLQSVAGMSEKTAKKVTPEQLIDHCQQMLGKEIFFEVLGNANYEAKVDENLAAEVEKDIQQTKEEVGNHFDMLLKSAEAILDKRKPVKPVE